MSDDDDDDDDDNCDECTRTKREKRRDGTGFSETKFRMEEKQAPCGWCVMGRALGDRSAEYPFSIEESPYLSVWYNRIVEIIFRRTYLLFEVHA